MAEPKVLTDIRNLQTGLSGHTANTNIHTTVTEKNKWNGYGTKFKPQIALQQLNENALNTTLEPLVLATIGGQLWYVETEFWQGNAVGNNRVQMAKRYSGNGDIITRNYFNGVWSAWSPSIQQCIDKKNEGIIKLVNALGTKGITLPTNATFQQIVDGINSIQTGFRKARGLATLQSRRIYVPGGTFGFTPTLIFVRQYDDFQLSNRQSKAVFTETNAMHQGSEAFSYFTGDAQSDFTAFFEVNQKSEGPGGNHYFIYNGGFVMTVTPEVSTETPRFEWVAIE